MIVNRSQKLEWKLNPTIFQLINAKALGAETMALGSAVKPVRTLLANDEELKVILPAVIGVAPNSPSWQESVTDYLNNFHLDVPRRGIEFDLSVIFNRDNERTKDAIDKYCDEHKLTDESDEDIIEKILGKSDDGKFAVPETELYKYVDFVNPIDYINWRFCLLSAKVANNVEDVDKSTNIQFYLTSEDQLKKARAAKLQLTNKAMKHYVSIISSTNTNKVDLLTVALKLFSNASDYKESTLEERQALIMNFMQDNPSEFIAAVSDKSLENRAKVQMYIWMGILKQSKETNIITDAHNPEIVLGATISEAISYLENDKNAAYANELFAKYKSLM